MCVCVCVCVCLSVCLLPTHCTLHASSSTQCGYMAIVWSIFDSRTSWTDHITWGNACLYLCTERSEVRVTVKLFCCVSVLCVGLWWMEGRRSNLLPASSLLLLISTERSARRIVPNRRTNRYQQYNMPSQHTVMYYGSVWNLIQAINVQSSD